MARNRMVRAVALTAVVAVSACGSGESGSSDPPPTTGPDTAIDESSTTPAVLTTAEASAGEVTVPTDAPPGPVTSGDGVLSIEPPGDGTSISIDEQAGLDDVVGFDRLGTYELGPSGARFDPPLRATLHLDDATLDAGVAVAHVLDDGSRRPVDLVRVDGGLAFELDSFSRVEVATIQDGEGVVSVPTSAVVDEPFTVDLAFPNHEFALRVDGGKFQVGAPVAASGNTFVCTEQGEGRVSHDDDILLTHPGDTGGFAAYFFPAVHYRVVFDQPVTCRPKPVVVPPTDHRCLVRSTGEPSDGCPPSEAIDAGFSFIDGEMAVDIAATPDAESVIAAGIDAAGDFRYIEFAPDGTTGFFGAGFANFTPDLADGPFIDGGDRVVLSGVPFQVDDDGMLWVTLPGGADNDGGLLPPLTGRLVDVTVFVESADGIQGIYFWDPAVALAAALSGSP